MSEYHTLGDVVARVERLARIRAHLHEGGDVGNADGVWLLAQLDKVWQQRDHLASRLGDMAVSYAELRADVEGEPR